MRKHRLCRLLVFMIIILSACNSPSIAFTVDGAAVEKEELVYYMRFNTSAVADILEKEHGLDSFDEGFWGADYGGIRPLEYLKEYTIREISRSKIEQLMAAEYKIDTPLTWSRQHEAHKKQNEERKKAHAAGETVYGAVERDFAAYHADMMNGMRAKLMESLEKAGRILISEDMIRDYCIEHGLEGGAEANRGPVHQYLLERAYQKLIDERFESGRMDYSDLSVGASDIA